MVLIVAGLRLEAEADEDDLVRILGSAAFRNPLGPVPAEPEVRALSLPERPAAT